MEGEGCNVCGAPTVIDYGIGAGEGAGAGAGAVCGDSDIDQHIFYRPTLPQLPPFYHTVLNEMRETIRIPTF